MLLARLRTPTAVTRSLQTRAFANMLGAATQKTEKAAAETVEAAQSVERGDIVLGECRLVDASAYTTTQ